MSAPAKTDSATVVGEPRGGPDLAAPGASVGRYVVVEEIGRGAMGRVVRAYDPKLQREVALKEVRGALLGDVGKRRLVGEARAMAKLSHQNVVGVYDVEELPGGELVIVMEYVAGTTLRQWSSHEQRPWREVVRRYAAAGRGLAAAHAAGLLHRDFKPANVLVSGSSVKVTDFGLAKTVAGETTRDSGDGHDEELTQDGTVLGTPRYMAPEQHAGESLTPAADQYALCVALWEALCGTPPFSGKDLAEQKRAGPGAWPDPAVPLPIANAVIRGLSPDPSQRWPALGPLLEALRYDPRRLRRRWLAGLGGVAAVGIAVASLQPWAAARAKRCAGAAIQLEGIWNDARRVEIEAAILGIEVPYAGPVSARVTAELDGYAARWQAMHTQACEATTVHGEQSTAVMDLRMACLHRAKVELDAVADVLASADENVVKRAHDVLGALRPLSRCEDVDALRAEVEPPSPDEAAAVEAAQVMLSEARAQRKAGRYGEAERILEDAKAALSSVEYGPVQTELALAQGWTHNALGEYDAAVEALERALESAARWRQWKPTARAASLLMFVIGSQQQRTEQALRYRELAEGSARGDPMLEAEVADHLASVLSTQGKYEEAEREHRRALGIKQQVLGADHPDVAVYRNNLAGVLHQQGKYDEAEAEFRAALAVRQRALGPDHPHVAASRNAVAVILYAQGKYLESEAEHRAVLVLRERALGPGHPRVADSHNNIGAALTAQGKHRESEAEHRAALALRKRALGPEHPEVAASLYNIAAVLHAQGKDDEAYAQHRAALALRKKTLGPDHPEVAVSLNGLANVLQRQGKYAEALAEHRAALALYERTLGADHPHVAGSHNNIGMALDAQGKHGEAEAEYRAAVAIFQTALGPDHPQVAAVRNNIGAVLETQGKYEEAEAQFRAALVVRQRALGPDHPAVAGSRSAVATALVRLGRADEAVELAEQAWERRQRDDVRPTSRSETAFVLAQALWATDTGPAARRRARELAKRALEELRDVGDSHAEQAAEIAAWLRRHTLKD